MKQEKKKIDDKFYTRSSSKENSIQDQHTKLLKNCPIPDNQILSQLGLFLNSKHLSRILFMDHIYKRIIDVQGIVMDLGTRWGHNAALFTALRGIYEPFNQHRKIVAFDTFKGFPSSSLSKKDGKIEMMTKGGLKLTKNYFDYLNKVMELQEGANPMSHIKKFDLIKGDANVSMGKYLKEHPETIIALAYFDFDLYKPTKKCLQAIRPHLVKGSILGFDELNESDAPGETLALDEVFGLNNIKLKRFPYASRVSYFVVE